MPTTGSGGLEKLRLAFLASPTFPALFAQQLTQRLSQNGSVVDAEQADVLVVMWDGKPGREKEAIDRRTRNRQDVVAIKPDGTFTRMGFGCLTA